MSLRDATPRRPLPPGPPYACGSLVPWEFTLPAGDPRLVALHAGEREEVPAHAMIAGNVLAWADSAANMDFLDPASPVHAQKRLERALYLDRWDRHLPAGARVLDLGGGIGRFAQVCLARDCEVELVDPDLRALRRAVAHAAGGPGKLDVHWSTGERLPELAPVDVAIVAEVLCYCEDPARVLANVRRVLRPGGALLLSVEARWGWALTHDVLPGGLSALLGDGVVHVAGDRFVRTYDRDALVAQLAGWTIEECVATHYVLSGPFEGIAGELRHDELLRWEARLREHPVTAPWHRAWTVVARHAG